MSFCIGRRQHRTRATGLALAVSSGLHCVLHRGSQALAWGQRTMFCLVLSLVLVHHGIDSQLLNPQTVTPAPAPLDTLDRQELEAARRKLIEDKIVWSNLYKYGKDNNDVGLYPQPNLDRQIDLDFYYPYYGFRFNYTFISPNGFVSFNMPHWIQPPYTFPNPKWPDRPDPSFVAPFFSKATYQHVGRERISHVWFRTVHRPRVPTNPLYWQTVGSFANRLNPSFQQINMAGRVFDGDLLDSITRDIQDGVVGSQGFRADYALIVTWERMAYGGAPKVVAVNEYESAKKWQNTFQLVLATDEIRSFTVFNYASVNWTAPTDSGALRGRGGIQGAMAGFNGGNNTGFTALPYSGQGDVFKLANFMASVTPGRWVYRVDELLIPGGCSNKSTGSVNISPFMSTMLGGVSVNVSGPCLLPGTSVKLLFDELAVNCQRVNMGYARCLMPMLYKVGNIVIKMSVDGGRSYSFVGAFYIQSPHRAVPSFSLIDDVNDARNSWDAPTPDVLKMSWDNKNLTWALGAKVDVEVWGYWENAEMIRWNRVGFVAKGISNTGSYTFEPTKLDLTDVISDFDRYDFGALRVSVVGNAAAGGWFSKLTPLAWFLNTKWEEAHGDTWALEKCRAWFELEGRRIQPYHSLASKWACPCVLDQALADFGRFMPTMSCDQFGNSNCPYNRGALHCVMSTWPSSSASQQICCYDYDGYLLMSDDYDNMDRLRFYGPGVLNAAHEHGAPPYKLTRHIPSLSYWTRDRMAYYFCCRYSEHCELYFWRRQTNGCQDYKPVVLGHAYGATHFVTFDGSEYTFAGNGFYTLVMSDHPKHQLNVQIRMERAPRTQWNTYPNTSVITGVAIQEGDSDVIEVLARSPYRRWSIAADCLVNGGKLMFDGPDMKLQVFKNVQVFSPALNHDNSDVFVHFRSGAGVRVIEKNGVLRVVVALPDSFNITDKYTHKQSDFIPSLTDYSYFVDREFKAFGLLGLFDGTQIDDFVTPEGDVVGANFASNQRAQMNTALFYQFGEKWRVDGSNPITGDVLFSSSFQPIYAPQLFQDRSSVPDFDPENNPVLRVAPFEVKTLCHDNYECKYDYFNTVNRDIARATLSQRGDFLGTRSSGTSKLQSCGPLYKSPHVIKHPMTNNYLEGSVVFLECRPNYFRHGDHERVCINGTWTPGWTVWCRSRSLETTLKWLTGILTSLLFILMFASIFATCYWFYVKPNVLRKYTSIPTVSTNITPESIRSVKLYEKKSLPTLTQRSSTRPVSLATATTSGGRNDLVVRPSSLAGANNELSNDSSQIRPRISSLLSAVSTDLIPRLPVSRLFRRPPSSASEAASSGFVSNWGNSSLQSERRVQSIALDPSVMGSSTATTYFDDPTMRKYNSLSSAMGSYEMSELRLIEDILLAVRTRREQMERQTSTSHAAHAVQCDTCGSIGGSTPVLRAKLPHLHDHSVVVPSSSVSPIAEIEELNYKSDA